MKNIIVLMLLSCLFGLYLLATDTPSTASPEESSCGCPNSGGTVHYRRGTSPCPNAQGKTEVTCVVGGNELCIPQNCP